MKRTKFDVVVDIWISIVINIALSIVLPLVALHMITWGIFFKGFAIAFVVSTAFVFIVPVIQWGGKFAGALGAKPHSIPSQLLSTIIVALVLGTFMTLLMTAVNAGIGPHFFFAWLSCYPYALLAVYISALIGIWTGVPIAMKICGVPQGIPMEK